jgi:uncharacterized membrane protein (UPF0127 family)/CheY-like chemotaxis protein
MAATRFIMTSTGWETICEQAVLADRPLRRMRGLLGRKSISPGEGMLLRPAPAIHTAFMRFAIDIVFLDFENNVLSVVDSLVPWRTAADRHAYSALELAPGEAKRLGITPGDQLVVLTQDPAAGEGAPAGLDQARGRHARKAARESERTGARSPAAGPGSVSVLLVSSDRRFRAVAAALLERRGCKVLTSDDPEHVLDTVAADKPGVVMLDTGKETTPSWMVARLRATSPEIGVVLVGDGPGRMSGLEVRPRWGVFDDLVSAILEARGGEGGPPVLAAPA